MKKYYNYRSVITIYFIMFSSHKQSERVYLIMDIQNLFLSSLWRHMIRVMYFLLGIITAMILNDTESYSTLLIYYCTRNNLCFRSDLNIVMAKYKQKIQVIKILETGLKKINNVKLCITVKDELQ